MSIVINNAVTREGEIVNILIEDGIISDIKRDRKFDAEQIIDAKNSLVTESFISPHIHLDKVLIGDIIEPNKSGTLWEAIQKTWEVKRKYTIADIKQRASKVIDQQIKFGVTHIRTHVDVDSIGNLIPLKGLLAVKEAYQNVINLQIVAFPQEGILKDEGTEERLYKAIESGATLIGGMPHNEDTPEDSERHIDIVFDIAKQFDVNIDSHTDETDDPNSRTLQYLASSAIKRNFQGRVTVGHICSLASQDDYYAARVIDLLKRANVNVVTNPPTNMVLQGRLDKYPKRTGITRVKELLAANINVSCGQDCINDPYYPYGKGDMLEVASLTAHAAKMTSQSEITKLYEMITSNAAQIMGFSNHQMKIGAPANLVILYDIKTMHDAIRLNPPSRTTIQGGKIISRTSLKEEFFFKGVEGEE